MRALGDALDDIVAALRGRDLLALGRARKLLADWREIDQPMLWYPTEIRCEGKLVLAAELERASFVLPAYQAGLRAVLLRPETSVQDVLALCERLLQLELGTLSHSLFFSWLWNGNPGGLATLLGHPLDQIATTVIEHKVDAKDIWSAHTTAAMDEWNSLAWAAAQTHDAATLEQRYRAPLNRLVQRIEKGDLALDAERLMALRRACDDSASHAQLERALLTERPDLAAFLAPDQAALFMEGALAAGAKLPSLLACLGQMSGEAASAALSACPELMPHAPTLCAELLTHSEDGLRGSALARALFAHGGKGARRLAEDVLRARGEGYPPRLLVTLFNTLVDLTLGEELVVPIWMSAETQPAVRALAVRALGRDPVLLANALRARPVEAGDSAPIHEALADARDGAG